MQDETFHRFVEHRRRDLERIAKHTRGDQTVGDVCSEAWLMAMQWGGQKGAPLNLARPADQELLLRHLYQHLVRYTDIQFRHAIRLDQAPPGFEADKAHPLRERLASDERMDPLAQLLESEVDQTQGPEPGCHESLAGAYLHLLRHHDNRMLAVARHLMISMSHCYRCCRDVRFQARIQSSLTFTVTSREPFLPGPWRRHRYYRESKQLAFDFDDELAL